MERLLIDLRDEADLFYPQGGGDWRGIDIDDYDRISVLFGEDHGDLEEIVGEVGETEVEAVLSDLSTGVTGVLESGVDAVEIPHPVTPESEEWSFGTVKEAEEAVQEFREEGITVRLHLPVTSENYGKLEEVVEFADSASVEKMLFTFPDPSKFDDEGQVASLTRMGEPLKDAIDQAILRDLEVEVRGLPLCQMVGYKRYLTRFRDVEEKMLSQDSIKPLLELESADKLKPGQCNICKYEDGCSGIWEDYVDEKDSKEITPITGKVVLTDNERCMVSILMEEDGVTTKRVLELKGSERFKDICANCVGSDDVMVTGNNLKEKGVVDKEFAEDGYKWELQENSELVQQLREQIG
ncbi:MAG: hypothetical protein MUP63_04160 [Candidatus Nanohaloarchaeota archaeon QJJ-7]|nr:hypothetical protein [Candidatus Nanohaloarchaeota archaeon QJJ-7]